MYKAGIIIAMLQVITVIVASIVERRRKVAVSDATLYPIAQPTQPIRVAEPRMEQSQPVVEIQPIEQVSTLTYEETEISPIPDALVGMSFSITGKLPVRREAFAALIERYGGEWHSRPRKSTQYIIVGDTGEYATTGKLTAALANGAKIISADEVCAMCGVSVDSLADDDAIYEGECRVQATAALRRVQSSIRRTTKSMEEGLRIYVQQYGEVIFAEPVRVMTDVDEVARCVSIQMHQSASHKQEYILHTTEGEAVYLDDVYPGCIADIFAAAMDKKAIVA